MDFKKKRIAWYAFLVYGAANLFTYLFKHLHYNFQDEAFSFVFYYGHIYLSKVLEFLAPPIIATLAFLVMASKGKLRALLFTLTVSSAKVFYTLFYYYMTYTLDYGFVLGEAIIAALLVSIVYILFTVLGVFLSIGIYSMFFKLRAHKKSTISDVAFDVEAPFADFLARGNRAVFTFALLRFLYSFLMELLDSIIFLIEYHYDYTALEISTMLFNFVLLLALFIASYLIAAYVRKRVVIECKE